MSSQKVKYPEYDDFLRLLFSIVEQQLNYDPKDPLPDYRREDPGGLESVLSFIRNDDFYPSLLDKAAYLFVGIIEGHSYSNGNKRLAFVSLLYFLITNGYDIAQSAPRELKELALFVADKERNKNAKFEELKRVVRGYLKTHIEQIK